MRRIGTAGWAIPRIHADHFPTEGSGLQRYAARFAAVEINSTFYRPHRASTLERWLASVPEDFRFSLKLPKAISHEARLMDCGGLIARFLEETAPLAPRLGPLLCQLPPSLAFEAEVAAGFFATLRQAYGGPAACEPRHASWFTEEADDLLGSHHVARVAADPAKVPEAAEPGGWVGFVYRRLHGSPRVYYSDYEPEYLERLAVGVAADPDESWCIFDNTTSGAAAGNALSLQANLAN